MIKKTKTALGLVAALGAAVLTSAPVNADQISDLNARIAKLESAEAVRSTAVDNGNMVFFRSGFSNEDVARTDILTGTGNSRDGWYFGAGLDLNVSDDLFGFSDDTEFLAEIMFDYKEFGTAPLASAVGGGPVTLSKFTLSASPKVKFMKGSKFRPWIIPIGFAINVISPPSAGVTVLEPAMMFGIGGDYNIWNSLYVGADFRYNLAIGSTLDGVDTDGLTTGAYIGFGF